MSTLEAARAVPRSSAGTVTVAPDRPVLPVRLRETWPLTIMFAWFPLWWILGLGSFVWPIIAAPMLVALIWRQRTRAPAAMVLWLGFTGWVLLSGFELHSGTKALTFCYRLALYAGAAVMFLYVYNLPRRRTLDARVLRILVIFWGIVIAGGYAGILLGGHTFTAPLEHLLPHGLRNQPFIQELVQPVFADTSGSVAGVAHRPAAPFTYTNEWGGNIAVLTMVALAAIAAAGPGRRRKVLIALAAASLVPMVFSLNRGMFLSLVIGVVYVTVRLAARGRVGALISLLTVTAVVVAALVLTPLGHLALASLHSTHGHSNATRLSLYRQAIAGANASPFLGHGEPQPVTGAVLAGTPAIGTQGQLWMVLYSNGYLATLLFVGFFLAVLWQTRRARGTAGLWLHAAPLVALVQIAVYGWLPVELQVVMVVAALAYRRCWRMAGDPGVVLRQARTPDPQLATVPAAPGRPAPALKPAAARGAPLGAPATYVAPESVDATLRSRAALSAEAATVARGSLINLGAMVTGAGLSFALTVLVSRWLHPSGAGGFFELIALFTILSSTFELGADTGLTRWISRARAIGGLADVRRIVGVALAPVLVTGTAAAVGLWVAAPTLAHLFLHGMAVRAGAADIRIVAPLVPLGALSACMLDGARGFGRMWPYLAVEGLGKPTARIALVTAALAAGLGLHGAVLSWGLPVIAGLIAAWLILAMLIRAEAPARQRRPPRSPASRPASVRPPQPAGPPPETLELPRVPFLAPRQLASEFWRFTAPRGAQAIFQVVVLWLDILIVGALVSRYAAGIYGAVSKLALVGTFALEGQRLAIAPQLSALLAHRDNDRAAALYQSATRWLMLASWPLYLVFAIFPAVVLGIFGTRYTAGAAALAVLAGAMLVNLGTGNVTVVLLMGGKSSWSAINAAAALAVNIGLNLILVPRLGIVGAAIAWAASIAVDNIAAMIEIKWVLGLAPFGTGYALAAAATVGCFGVTGFAVREALGQTLPALIITLGAGLISFAAVLYAARRPLQLSGISAILPGRSRLAGRTT